VRLYNTLTRREESFAPASGNTVRLYACGLTVYARGHIGNFRTFVCIDVLRRTLTHLEGREIRQVVNFTDVDDKTILGAQKAGMDLRAYTEQFVAAFHDDTRALGIEAAEEYPRATDPENIKSMVDLIAALTRNGCTYVSDGSIYFKISSMPDYGKLAHLDKEGMLDGARVSTDDYTKENARDFVLWKATQPGEPTWNEVDPPGRPGWHLECSAMALRLLGEPPIDIHAGGIDLLFPHHENEIAQSTCAHGGKVFARWWMHNGMLTFDGRKMSKSLGNVLLLHELLKLHPAEALRLRLLSGHYRQPLDWSEGAIAQAVSTLDGWYRVLRDLADIELPAGDLPVPAGVEAALCDDLNTPQALAELSVLADAARQSGTAAAKAALLGGGALLGLLQQDAEAWFKRDSGQAIDAAHIDALLEERRAARAARDFRRADAIRDELAAMNIAIEDGAQGTRWSVQKS
jgi:cysteinyl-tRNA synthetase